MLIDVVINLEHASDVRLFVAIFWSSFKHQGNHSENTKQQQDANSQTGSLYHVLLLCT